MSTAHSTFYGKDGRIYRGGNNATLEMADGVTNLQHSSVSHPPSRVASAHHRNNRFSDGGVVRDTATFDHLNASMNAGGSKGKMIQTPFGIHAEVRKRKNMGSRTSHTHANVSGSNHLESTSQPGGGRQLSQNMSSVNFAQGTMANNTSNSMLNNAPGHQRKKLPIGFLVQQEKRELHKMGMQLGSKMRPDSAKVTLGNRSRALLSSEL